MPCIFTSIAACCVSFQTGPAACLRCCFILWQCTKASRAFGWVVEAEESAVSQRGQGLIEVQWFDQGQGDKLVEIEIRVGRFCSGTAVNPPEIDMTLIVTGSLSYIPVVTCQAPLSALLRALESDPSPALLESFIRRLDALGDETSPRKSGTGRLVGTPWWLL